MLKYLQKGVYICCFSQVIKAKPESLNKTEPCVVGQTEQKLTSVQGASPAMPSAPRCAMKQPPSLERVAHLAAQGKSWDKNPGVTPMSLILAIWQWQVI